MREELYKQLDELEKKARKYDHRREQDEKIVGKIRDALELLKEAIADLDPASAVSNKVGQVHTNKKQIIAELYEKIQAGLEVNTDFVAKTYDLPTQQALYCIQQLKTMPNIDRRTESRKLFLFCKIDR